MQNLLDIEGSSIKKVQARAFCYCISREKENLKTTEYLYEHSGVLFNIWVGGIFLAARRQNDFRGVFRAWIQFDVQ